MITKVTSEDLLGLFILAELSVLLFSLTELRGPLYNFILFCFTILVYIVLDIWFCPFLKSTNAPKTTWLTTFHIYVSSPHIFILFFIFLNLYLNSTITNIFVFVFHYKKKHLTSSA